MHDGDNGEARAGRPKMTAGQRTLSAAEFVVGAAIVIGHNVYHVVPNEVLILFVLGIVSIRLRSGNFAAVGLGRPKSWWLTILIAVIAAAIVLTVGQYVTEPIAKTLGLHENAGAAAHALQSKNGDVVSALKGLALVWTFAAFGEEISYRRYLLGRAAEVAHDTNVARWCALVCVSVLFGFGHFYQGSAGIFTTGCDGFMIGAAYLLSRRNLWVAVITHGLVDTVAIGLLYFGLND